MTNKNFYANLPVLNDFSDITILEKYKKVPKGWNVIITDIKNSTRAIEEGRYKDVNTVGASSIIAVLNAVKKIDIPFVFGGDGATMLVPLEVLKTTKAALLATKQLAKEMFSLDLRVGIVPIEEITKKGLDIKVAKFKASDNYHQAMFFGEGLSYAERIVKSEGHELKMDTPPKANYEGLECRWQDVYSQHGETVSLIVKATSTNQKEASITYKKVLSMIRSIYGTEEHFHPLSENKLKLATSGTNLDNETKVRTWGKSIFRRGIYKLYLKVLLFFTGPIMKSNIKLTSFDIEEYKKILLATSDYKKFDNALRLVMAGNTKQRNNLTSALNKLKKENKIFYGIHVTDRALMTCLVFERYGKQAHFVDGADGGYAKAAKSMKEQIKKLKEKN